MGSVNFQKAKADGGLASLRTEPSTVWVRGSSCLTQAGLQEVNINNPKLFLELVNDENVQLRNFGIKATEMGILKLSSDQRTFMWGSHDRNLMTVPFDAHPYSALASCFKTDEGMEISSNFDTR